MAAKIFVDLDARRFVESALSTAPADLSGLFRGDVDDFEIYFLERTNNSAAPYAYSDKSAASVKAAIGSKLGTPTSGSWTLDGASFTFEATATQLQTALRTSQSDASLTVVGSMADGFTITWGAVGAESLLAGDASGLLPSCDLSVTERRAGTGSVKEQQFVRVRLSPAAYQDTWTDLTTSVTATISEVVAGSSTANEIQKIAFFFLISKKKISSLKKIMKNKKIILSN
jgi:hypothetical protein